MLTTIINVVLSIVAFFAIITTLILLYMVHLVRISGGIKMTGGSLSGSTFTATGSACHGVDCTSLSSLTNAQAMLTVGQGGTSDYEKYEGTITSATSSGGTYTIVATLTSPPSSYSYGQYDTFSWHI